MTAILEYYRLLDILPDSSQEEIKKAYRKKARLYHPDVNPSPQAKDQFIIITEAYEFLMANYNKISSSDEAFNQAMEDWKKYRQDISRRRAAAYARASYNTFKNTKFYKTTKIFNSTAIIFGMLISVMILIYTVYGYIFRLRHPVPGLEKPSVFVFIMLLILGMIFFVVSFIFLKAYIETLKRSNKRHNNL